MYDLIGFCLDFCLDDDQEGVMDNLLEALKTGSAFAVGRDGKGRKRTPRAAGGNALTPLFLIAPHILCLLNYPPSTQCAISIVHHIHHNLDYIIT